MTRLSLALTSLALALLTAAAHGQAKGELKPDHVWAGRLAGKDKEALKKLSPAAGYVADAKTFAKLWQAWRTEEKVPDVDFARKLVLVATVDGPNTVNVTPMLDAKGDLTFRVVSTLIGGDGFGYALAAVDRKGVKSVNGKPLPAAE